MTRIED